MSDTAEGRNVLAVPEFGIAHLLRPYEGFEAIYEGVLATTPIMVTEGNQSRDPIAALGTTGYDPELVRGLNTVVGARVLICLPSLSMNELNGEPYTWKFTWRYRNLFDHRITQEARASYHLAKQGLGIADVGGANPGARVVIPAMAQSLVFNQTEPDAGFVHAQSHLRAEDMQPQAARDQLPLMPNGANGAIQQGLLPSTTQFYTAPMYVVHEVQALGDELIIGFNRNLGQHNNWAFATIDLHIANFLGSETPDLGVYVLMGVAP